MTETLKKYPYLMTLSFFLTSCANQYLDYSDLSHAQRGTYYQRNHVEKGSQDYYVRGKKVGLEELRHHYKRHGATGIASRTGTNSDIAGCAVLLSLGALTLGLGGFAAGSLNPDISEEKKNLQFSYLYGGIAASAGIALLGWYATSKMKNPNHHMEFNQFLKENLEDE